VLRLSVARSIFPVSDRLPALPYTLRWHLKLFCFKHFLRFCRLQKGSHRFLRPPGWALSLFLPDGVRRGSFIATARDWRKFSS
jgi:hypothetical protein